MSACTVEVLARLFALYRRVRTGCEIKQGVSHGLAGGFAPRVMTEVVRQSKRPTK